MRAGSIDQLSLFKIRKNMSLKKTIKVKKIESKQTIGIVISIFDNVYLIFYAN